MNDSSELARFLPSLSFGVGSVYSTPTGKATQRSESAVGASSVTAHIFNYYPRLIIKYYVVITPNPIFSLVREVESEGT